jgi:tetratricopeptide (TPR) repeat protein
MQTEQTSASAQSAYNLRMLRALSHSMIAVFLLSCAAFAQATHKTPPASGPSAAERGVTLAESGHCAEALPLLKSAVRQVADRDLKKRVGLDGLHCAITHDPPYDALEFLSLLGREFPRDPEVLYAATHAYSDLSLRTSQDLLREAPFSYQVHELNAETLEVQGRWDEAIVEYQKILGINPLLPGVHARLGRALLEKPNPTPEIIQEAKKNFEAELEINPNNANAEYVLGALAKDANDSSSAIAHFTRAAKLDAGFSDAYLGLGTALVDSQRFSEAIPPLEKYEKMAPDSPTGHYELALAYAGVGRKDDANREANLQREAAASLEAVKRRVALGLEQQHPSAQPADSPQPDAPPQPK